MHYIYTLIVCVCVLYTYYLYVPVHITYVLIIYVNIYLYIAFIPYFPHMLCVQKTVKTILRKIRWSTYTGSVFFGSCTIR